MKYVDLNGLGKFLQGIKEMFSDYITKDEVEEGEKVIAASLNEIKDELDKKTADLTTIELSIDDMRDKIETLDSKFLEVGFEENFVMGGDVYIGGAEIGEDGESIVMLMAEYDEENESITIK